MSARRRFVSLLARAFALVAPFVLSGCASAPPASLEPAGAVAISIAAGQKQVAATAAVRNLVTITLPPAPSPGHEWQIAQHDSRFLRQTTDFLPAETSGAGPRVSFVALTSGRTRLRFVLLPVSSGRAVEPVDLRDVVLVID